MRLTAIAALVLSLASSLAAEERIRVYLVTPATTTGFVDQELKDEQSVVKALRKDLQRRKVEFVESAEGADVILDVLSMGIEQTGTATSAILFPNTGMVSGRTRATTERVVVLKLTAGNYEQSFVRLAGNLRLAANWLGFDVGKWIKDNRGTLLQRR